MYLNCISECRATHARLLGASIGHDQESFEAGAPCGCSPLYNAHLDYGMRYAVSKAAKAGGVDMALTTMLREPVARVISEFEYLASSSHHTLYQDQWDFLDYAGRAGLSTFGLEFMRLRNRSRSTSHTERLGAFVEFINLQPSSAHPTHNRQTRYLAGFPRGKWSASCCFGHTGQRLIEWAELHGLVAGAHMEGAVGLLREQAANVSAVAALHGIEAWPALTDASLKVATAHLLGMHAFGLLERIEESLKLFSERIGWTHLGNASKHAKSHKGAGITLSPEITRRVRELNAYDVALYAQASQRFDSQLSEMSQTATPDSTPDDTLG